MREARVREPLKFLLLYIRLWVISIVEWNHYLESLFSSVFGLSLVIVEYINERNHLLREGIIRYLINTLC